MHKGKKGEKERDWETRLFTWTGDTKEFGAVSVCYRLMSFASIWLQTLGNKGEVPRSWGSFYFGRKGNDRAEKNFFVYEFKDSTMRAIFSEFVCLFRSMKEYFK